MEPFTVEPARWAKGMMAVTPHDDIQGFKGRVAYLIDHLKGRWSNRERVYIMSPSKVAKLRKLYAEGYSATIFGELVAPDEILPGVPRSKQFGGKPMRLAMTDEELAEAGSILFNIQNDLGKVSNLLRRRDDVRKIDHAAKEIREVICQLGGVDFLIEKGA